MNFNKLILGGHLVKDIEVTKLKENTPEEIMVGKGAVAVNMASGKDENGKTKTEPMYVNFKAFGKRASNMAKFFKKGSGILLEGQMRELQYEDKNGNKKRVTYMLVEKFDFVDKLTGNTESESNNAQDSEEDMY